MTLKTNTQIVLKCVIVQPVGVTNYYYNLREISKRFELPVGKYCVIPSTFNSGEEAKFLIKVYVEKCWGSSKQSKVESFSLDTLDSAPSDPSVTSQSSRRKKITVGMKIPCRKITSAVKEKVTSFRRKLKKSHNFVETSEEEMDTIKRAKLNKM